LARNRLTAVCTASKWSNATTDSSAANAGRGVVPRQPWYSGAATQATTSAGVEASGTRPRIVRFRALLNRHEGAKLDVQSDPAHANCYIKPSLRALLRSCTTGAESPMSRFSTDVTVQIKRMMWEMGAASGPKGQLVAGAIPKLVRRGLVAVEREGGGGCRNPKSTPPPYGLVRLTRVSRGVVRIDLGRGGWTRSWGRTA